MGLQVKSARANKMGQHAIPFRCTASRCRACSHKVSSQILCNLCATYVQRSCKADPLTEFSIMSCRVTEKGDMLRELRGAPIKEICNYSRGAFAVAEGRCWMAMRISSGSVRSELGLELRAGVGHGLVAHVQILGDHSVGLPSATSASVCSSRTVMRRKGLVVPLASMKATSEARS